MAKKLIWRKLKDGRLYCKSVDASIYGPCEMDWYRVWVGSKYAIVDSIEEAKAFVEHSLANKA